MPGRLGKYMDLKMMVAKGGTNISHSTAKRFCADVFRYFGIKHGFFGTILFFWLWSQESVHSFLTLRDTVLQAIPYWSVFGVQFWNFDVSHCLNYPA